MTDLPRTTESKTRSAAVKSLIEHVDRFFRTRAEFAYTVALSVRTIDDTRIILKQLDELDRATVMFVDDSRHCR